MPYFDDPTVRLANGSKDQNVAPRQTPNAPDSYVRDLQNDLNTLGYAAGKADGWFGDRTEGAVRAFQSDALGTARQTQGGLGQPSTRLNESSAAYTGAVNGILDAATAREIQRWLQQRWQKPVAPLDFSIEDISKILPVNPALRPKLRQVNEIDRLVLHCTDAPPTWDVFACARYDIGPNHISAQGCPTITYAYFVNADGSVQKCLSSEIVSWHVGNWNRRSLGVVLAYRATGNSSPPPTPQLEAASRLFAMLCKDLRLTPEANAVGHRELLGTGYNVVNGKPVLRKQCPGLKVDLDAFRQDVAQRLKG